MFSLDLSLELINMVIIAAGVVLVPLNMAATLAPGAIIDFDGAETGCCVNALCK